MRVLDGYILKRFNRPFLYGLILFTGMLIITNIFQMINLLLTNEVPPLVAIEYFVCKVPLTLLLITPVAVLLATLFSLSGLLASNEITAMKASGISLYRIIAPVLIYSTLIGIMCILWNESVVPISTSKAAEIEQVEIRKGKIASDEMENISLWMGRSRLLNIGIFKSKEGLMESVQLEDRREDGSLFFRIDAHHAEWINNSWYFFKGIERRFDEEGRKVIQHNEFEERRIPDLNPPEQIKDMINLQKRDLEGVQNLSIRELVRYIKLLKVSGEKIADDRLWVDLHLKFSFPFTTIIMALIGASLALQRVSGPVRSFGLSILISFVYWGVIGMGRSLGYTGRLPPLLAAWMGNILFGMIGMYLAIKAKK